MKKNKREDAGAADNVIFVEAPQDVVEENERIAKQVRAKKRIITIGVILALVVIGGLFYSTLNREYKGYKVLSSSNTNYENSANYIKFCGNLLKYTPDGVSYIYSNGATVWSAGINMSSPIARTSGSYAVVADMGGNMVSVFNEEGQVSTVTMPYVICDIDVGKQGAFVVVLESEDTNYINMYNKKGEIVYEIQTTINKSGYPLDITISGDSKKLFTSYLNVGASSVNNSLAAYNFGDVGQNTNADRMVGGYKYDDEIISKVEFINNDTVVAFGTKTITVYSMKEKPTEKSKITLDKEIKSIFYSEEFFGTIEETPSEDGEMMYLVKAYNTKGNQLFDKKIDFRYNNIYASNKEIIISGDDKCIILRKNGTVKYNGMLSGNIKSIVSTGNSNEYVVVYDNATEIIKLKSNAVVDYNSKDDTEISEQ